MGLLRRSYRDGTGGYIPEHIAHDPEARRKYRLAKALLALPMILLLVGVGVFHEKLLGGKEQLQSHAQDAGVALALGAPVVEVFKRLGAPACQSAEADGTEKHVYRARQGSKAGECAPEEGDLVLWTRGTSIVRFTPVHGQSAMVDDAESFEQFRRRYQHGPPGGR